MKSRMLTCTLFGYRRPFSTILNDSQIRFSTRESQQRGMYETAYHFNDSSKIVVTHPQILTFDDLLKAIKNVPFLNRALLVINYEKTIPKNMDAVNLLREAFNAEGNRVIEPDINLEDLFNRVREIALIKSEGQYRSVSTKF